MAADAVDAYLASVEEELRLPTVDPFRHGGRADRRQLGVTAMPALSISRETWPIRGRFTISRGSRTAIEVVVVELEADGHKGRGEGVPYFRYGESLEGVVDTVEGVREEVEAGLDRAALQERLPAGAARNALDCAYWDLEAKLAGQPAWMLAGLPEPGPLTTAYTLSLDSVENMRAAAAANSGRPLLKLKLAGPEDLARVEAVREGAPQASLVVDANEGWSPGGSMARLRRSSRHWEWP